MIELVSIALLAALDLWLALPAAFALPTSPAISAIVMAIGGSLGALIAGLAANQISNFVQKRYSGYERMLDKTRGVLNKYGLPGIGLTAPVILGPLLTTVTAVVLGANFRILMLWIIVGNALWCLIFYIALLFGASFD